MSPPSSIPFSSNIHILCERHYYMLILESPTIEYFITNFLLHHNEVVQ
jgi:hypothetical protein